SGTDFDGSEGCTTSTPGAREIVATAATCRIPCVGRGGEKQRVTVGHCSHERLRGNVAARTRPIFDEKLLAKALGQPLADQASVGVVHAARRKAGNDPHWACRIGLRPGEAQYGWQPSSA